MLAIRLPEEMEKRLAALSEKTGETRTYYDCEVVLSFLEGMEQYSLAAEEFEASLKGGEEQLSAAVARERLGLDD